jgi:DHA2 family multidrug resistance protein
MNEAKDQGKAMAIWGMGIMIGPILGPSLGGYITEYYSWRYIFFINLPIGILSTIGLLKYLPEIASKGRKFDFLGCFLFSVFICSLQLFLDRGEEKDWLESDEIKTYLFLCIAFFAGFIHHVVFSKK